MVDPNDGTDAREEFLAEAQELIEALSRDLLLMDQAVKDGRDDPETLNDLFRSVHTLKGLAGMFGFGELGKLAHVLEDLLEDLRLGRVHLTAHTLDVLFEGTDNFQRLLTDAKGGDSEAGTVDLSAFQQNVQAVIREVPTSHDILQDYELDPNMLSVLTEYEEHRLRTNLKENVTVYRLRVKLQLDVIDTALAELKKSAGGEAEIITYLPSMDGGGGDSIEIEMLIASKLKEQDLRDRLNRPDAIFSVVGRRGRLSRAPRSQAPSRAPAPPQAELAPVHEVADEKLSLRSLTNVVRVDIRKLDHLMNVVGELGVVRNAMARVVDRLRSREESRDLATQVHRLHRSFARHLAEVQDGVLDIRMVPLAQLFDKVAVVVRQVGRDQQKEVRLTVTGSETEVDKLIAEELADPLMHIVRNAIDHGVETPQEREEQSKPPSATLAINAYHKGNHVVIELQDDGRGIDPGVVVESALRKGLLTDQVVNDMSREEVLNVVFLPGFSTSANVTEISGRGVGMDVVKTNITRLGGAVDLESDQGVGTKVTITLPVTLAIISALLFEVRGRLMSLPLASVKEAIRLDPKEVNTVEGRRVMTVRGETLPLCRLSELFGYTEDRSPGAEFVVVLEVGSRRLGLVVDRLSGQQDIVIKPLGRSLADVPGVSGATDLGDQHLVLVLDAVGLLEEVLMGRMLGVGAEVPRG